jgi:microcystin-dependent protein
MPDPASIIAAARAAGIDPALAQYMPLLFALISTMFGTGDGVTTFNIPDLRERECQERR